MKRLLFALTTAAAFWTAACGGGGGPTTPPSPTGKYSNASLNGTYAFTTSGEVFAAGAVSATPLARVGSFIADGKGGISGGTEDANSAGSASGPQTITGGSYTISADGRGTLTLVFSQNTLQFGITLTSTSDGLMIDESSPPTSAQFSTGSGNFTLQDRAVCNSSSPVTFVSGTYVFDFSGSDSSGAPESFVGEFTANNGATTANVGDINDNFTLFSMQPFTATLVPSTLPPAGLTACGRGTAQITTSQTGMQTYAFYVVNSGLVRFINSAGGEMLSGDAVLQTSVPASLSSGFAFIVSGSSLNGGLIRVGRFTANAANSAVLIDTNDAGTARFTQTTGATNFSISLDSTHPGRGTLTFLGNGLGIPFSFVFYLSSPSSGVIQETTQSSTANVAVAVADGSIAAQSGSPFTSSNISGTYALNWSGLSNQNTGGGFPVQDEEDFLGQSTISNLALTGAADIFLFQVGSPQVDNIVGGTISISGDGTGANSTTRNIMNVTLTKGTTITVSFNVYFVSPQLAFFANNIQTPSSSQRIVAGVLELQQ